MTIVYLLVIDITPPAIIRGTIMGLEEGTLHGERDLQGCPLSCSSEVLAHSHSPWCPLLCGELCSYLMSVLFVEGENMGYFKSGQVCMVVNSSSHPAARATYWETGDRQSSIDTSPPLSNPIRTTFFRMNLRNGFLNT